MFHRWRVSFCSFPFFSFRSCSFSFFSSAHWFFFSSGPFGFSACAKKFFWINQLKWYSFIYSQHYSFNRYTICSLSSQWNPIGIFCSLVFIKLEDIKQRLSNDPKDTSQKVWVFFKECIQKCHEINGPYYERTLLNKIILFCLKNYYFYYLSIILSIFLDFFSFQNYPMIKDHFHFKILR